MNVSGFEVQHMNASCKDLWIRNDSFAEPMFVAVLAKQLGFVSLAKVLEWMRQVEDEPELGPPYDEVFVLLPGHNGLLKVNLVLNNDLGRTRLLVCDAEYHTALFTCDLREKT